MILADALRRLFSRPRGGIAAGPSADPGLTTAVAGSEAVAITEALIAESLHYTGLPASSGLDSHFQGAGRQNHFGAPVRALASTGPVAGALGEALAGVRAAALVDSESLLSELSAVQRAAAWRVPMVVHVLCRATALPGPSLASAHSALHAVADCGAMVLHAADVQEVIDLTLLARQLGEAALLPVIVAVDAETAATRDCVRLPSRELVGALVGEPGQPVPCPTAAQELVFGANRRRLPRRVDLDRSAAVGAPLDRNAAAAASSALRDFAVPELREQLQSAARAFEQTTGRSVAPLWTRGPSNAKTAVVGQGAILAAARAVVDELNASEHAGIALVGIRCARPYPGAAVLEAVRNRSTVVVLENGDAPLAGEPPRTRELRSALQRSWEGQRSGQKAPTVRAALCPPGAGAAGAFDLGDLADALRRDRGSIAVVGAAARSRRSHLPKRQAMLDRLGRDYPVSGESPETTKKTTEAAAASGSRAKTWAVLRAGDDEARVATCVHRILGVADDSAMLRTVPSWAPNRELRLDIGSLGDPDRPRIPLAAGPPRVVLVTRRAAASTLPSWIRHCGALVVESAEHGPDEPDEPDEPDKRDKPDRHDGQPVPLRLAVHAAADDAPGAGWPHGVLEAPFRGPNSSAHQLAGALLRGMKQAGLIERDEHQLVRAFDAAVAGGLDESQQEQARGAFAAGFRDTTARPAPELLRPGGVSLPASVRSVAAAEDRIEPEASLARFHGTTSALYQGGRQSELCSEPFVATGLMPPMTAVFANPWTNSWTDSRANDEPPAEFATPFPTFDGAACTGCGHCWSSCPDGAIAPRALTPRALFEAGMSAAAARGAATDVLRPQLSKLTARASKACRKLSPGPKNAAELFAAMCKPEDGDEIATAVGAVVDALAPLDIARTEQLFEVPEAHKRATGQVLVLTVDPQRCQRCGICADVCDDGAISQVARSADAVNRASAAAALVDGLPDTPGDVIGAAAEGEQMSPLAAILMSRFCSNPLMGADGVEAGSGAKLALRQVLAVAEYQRQRSQQQLLRELTPVRDAVADRARELLANALPTEDVATLADGLDQIGDSTASLGNLTRKLEEVVEERLIDVERLRSLTEAGQQLANLEWQLSRGSLGLGRARLSLALASDGPLAGLVRYPFNPLVHPAVIENSRGLAALAWGLQSAQVERTLEVLRAIKLAQLELDNPARVAAEADSIARLDYDQLSASERSFVPPVVIAGGDELVASADLLALLDQPLPIKVLIFSQGHGAASAPTPASELALLGFGRRAAVVQTSIAYPTHLFRGVSLALAHPGPAVVRLFAPSPARDGFDSAKGIALAKRAVTTRLSPLLILDPTGDGVFGSRLDIGDNPAAEDVWVDEQTPADLWRELRRSREQLVPVPPGAASPLALATFAALDAASRDKHTPTAIAADGTRVAVSSRALEIALERHRSWRALQELAGVVTPFTGAVAEQVERRVERAHRAALESQKAQYEREIAQLRVQHGDELADRLRDALVALANRARNGARADGRPGDE